MQETSKSRLKHLRDEFKSKQDKIELRYQSPNYGTSAEERRRRTHKERREREKERERNPNLESRVEILAVFPSSSSWNDFVIC